VEILGTNCETKFKVHISKPQATFKFRRLFSIKNIQILTFSFNYAMNLKLNYTIMKIEELKMKEERQIEPEKYKKKKKIRSFRIKTIFLFKININVLKFNASASLR
jgi:hypothetical protein